VSTDRNRTRIDTPEGAGLDIVPIHPDHTPEITPAPGFPRGAEGSSTRIRYRAHGNSVDFPFLLLPRRDMTPVADLSTGWCAVRMPEPAGRDAGIPQHGVTGTSRCTATECGLAPGDGTDGWVWASKSFRLPPKYAPPRRLFLHVRSCGRGLHVWVNGRSLTVPGASDGQASHAGSWYLPATVEITAAVVGTGPNLVVIAGPTEQGKLVAGTVELLVDSPPQTVPQATQIAPGLYDIRGDFGQDLVGIADDSGQIAAGPFVARAAAALIQSLDGFALLQATRFAFADVQLWSDRPVDIDVAAGRVTLGRIAGPHTLDLHHPEFRLHIVARGVVDIDLIGSPLPNLVLHLDHDLPVFLNGQIVPVRRRPQDGRIEIVPAQSPPAGSDPGMPPYLQRMEQMMRIAESGDLHASDYLIEGLADPDWKVRQVAAELLGRTGDPAAVPPLLDLLAQETPEKMYHESLLWWKDAVALHATDPSRWNAGAGSSPDAVNRHRVKSVAIEALGRLRAQDAVPALCRIVEDLREFYPVHSLACQALGRIGDPAALPTLRRAADYAEVNTRWRARDAITRICDHRPAHPEYPDRSGA
jgi:hypothetical protein